MLKNDYTIKERKADEQVKVQKGRLIKEIIIVLLCMVLGSTLIELGANIRSIGKGKQSTVVPDESITLEGFVREGGGYYLQSGEGVLRCELNGEYLKKFIYDFDSKDLVDAKITVGYDNSMGKEETVTIEDKNPILLTRSVVNIGKKAKWIQISLSNIESGFFIRNIEVSNSFELNKYRVFSSNILIMGICLLVIFRKKIGKEIEYGFAVIALALGIVFVISIPTNKIGWDEETHFKRAYEMSLYPGEEQVSSEIAAQFRADTVYNYPYFQPQSYEEKQNLNGLMNYYYQDGDHAVTVKGKLCGVYTPGLVPQALAMKIARAMGMSFDCIFLAGRFAELLLYVFVMFFTIRIIPMGKRVLTFISLTPTSLFLAVTYTYDTVVFCFISLAFAIMMREWLAEKENVNMKRMLLANVFLIIGCLPKAIYAPVALIQTLIPAKRYENKKKRNQMMVVAGIVFLLLLASFVIPQMLNPSAMEDVRGGANVDSGQQMSLILTHPFAYAGIVLKNIWTSFADYAFAEACYRLLGHLEPAPFRYLIPILVVFLIATDYTEKLNRKINWKQKTGILIFLGMSVVLIWTALYVAFTALGSTSIGGVQGRYYRPLLWMLYLVCSSNFVEIKASNRQYNRFVLGAGMLVSGVTVWRIFHMFCI